MKRGNEIIKEWEQSALEDHKKSILVSLTVFLLCPALIIVAPFIVSENKRSLFILLLGMLFGYFLFVGLIKVIEQHGKMIRKERREWEQLEKRLRFKTKVQ